MTMNKFEKQVFNSLSEEEQEKIAGGGGISPDDDLTKKQCDKLRNAAKELKPNVIDLSSLQNPIIMYGLSMPRNPHWPTKPTKPLQPLNPVTPDETPQSTTAPGTTDKT